MKLNEYHFVLYANDDENDDANSNNIIFTIKIISPCRNFVDNFLDKKYQNFSANDLKDLCIEMNIKQKVKIRIQQTKRVKAFH